MKLGQICESLDRPQEAMAFYRQSGLLTEPMVAQRLTLSRESG